MSDIDERIRLLETIKALNKDIRHYQKLYQEQIDQSNLYQEKIIELQEKIIDAGIET